MEDSYAQALWQILGKGTQPKAAVHALVESLRVHKREELLPRIASAFERLAEREMRKNALIVSVADEKDAVHGKRAAKAALEELEIEGKELEVAIDSSLIGGWRLEGRGVLLDESFKKKLLDMYNAAIA